jgi:hypothetical protein
MIVGLFFFNKERNMSYKFLIRNSGSVLIVTKLIILKLLNYLTLAPKMEKCYPMLEKTQSCSVVDENYLVEINL